MTTYIPSITIPTQVFLNPAASILLPIALGTAVGYSTRRRQISSIPQYQVAMEDLTKI
jgi:benzodiazapine receptor